MDECVPYSLDDALAFGVADALCAAHGLTLSLHGPEDGRWHAEFYDWRRPHRRLIEGGYVSASSRAEAIRQAVELVNEALADELRLEALGSK
jgi:hypothetical protein